MSFSSFINNVLSKDIAIDAGSEMLMIYVKNEGIIIKERSYIAYSQENRNIIAYGNEAYDMLGKSPEGICVEKPIVNGTINDFEMTVLLYKHFISKLCRKNILKPRIIVSVPNGLTEIQKKAFDDLLKRCGARSIYMIEQSIASAIGAGCDVSLSRGLLVASIGGNICDVSAISLGKSVAKSTVAVAGDNITDEIIKYIKRNYNMIIGKKVAEKIKEDIASASILENVKSTEVAGCDIATGTPFKIYINSEEIRDSFYPHLKKTAETIKSVLEETPSELQADILEDGILITGGGAKLYGLDKWLKMELGIKVFIAEKPTECAVLGAGEQLDFLGNGQNSKEQFFYSAV